MSFGLNNWNNNQQVRDRMENDAQDYRLRETNPERDLISRMSVRGAILILLVIVLAVTLIRGM